MRQDFFAQADRLMAAAYESDSPGAVALVHRGGRRVWSLARGLADRDTATPLSVDLPMRIGSITKTFTAAVVLQLVEEGAIGLDDPLSIHLPGYPRPVADASVAQILGHSAGIANYTAIPGFMRRHSNHRHSTDQLIDAFRNAAPVFPAGTAWAYSNSGYVLLGAIIEAVTGGPWWEAVDARIAAPLGLVTLRYGGLPGAEENAARGYRMDNERWMPARPLDMSVPHAAGGLLCSAADLATWADALAKGRVVSTDSYARMAARVALPDGTHAPYGLGVELGAVLGRKTVGHGGSIFGFAADSFTVVDADLFVAVLGNAERSAADPKVMARQLAELALGLGV